MFEGHELQDALEVANTTLEDDVRVSEQDGRPEHVRPVRARGAAQAPRALVLRPPLRLAELRAEVVDVLRRLEAAGLVTGTSGNVSARDPQTG